jgi:hypothetical protein
VLWGIQGVILKRVIHIVCNHIYDVFSEIHRYFLFEDGSRDCIVSFGYSTGGAYTGYYGARNCEEFSGLYFEVRCKFATLDGDLMPFNRL